MGSAPALAQSVGQPPAPIDQPPISQPPGPGFSPQAVVVRQGASDASASEGKGSVKFTISLAEGQCFATVSYHTVDGTASAGQDYEGKSGEVSLSFDQNP